MTTLTLVPAHQLQRLDEFVLAGERYVVERVATSDYFTTIIFMLPDPNITQLLNRLQIDKTFEMSVLR